MTDLNERSPSSIPAGAVLCVFGAVLLVASLFLTWFEPDLSGWTAFEVLDLVLAACAGLALVEALRDLGADLPTPANGSGPWIAGSIGTIVVLSQIVNHPPAATGTDAGSGIWLALAASLLLLLAGLAGRVQVTFVGHGHGHGHGHETDQPPAPDPYAPPPAPAPSSAPSPFAPPAGNPYAPPRAAHPADPPTTPTIEVIDPADAPKSTLWGASSAPTDHPEPGEDRTT